VFEFIYALLRVRGLQVAGGTHAKRPAAITAMRKLHDGKLHDEIAPARELRGGSPSPAVNVRSHHRASEPYEILANLPAFPTAVAS
jgi:hypothetical protein